MADVEQADISNFVETKMQYRGGSYAWQMAFDECLRSTSRVRAG